MNQVASGCSGVKQADHLLAAQISSTEFSRVNPDAAMARGALVNDPPMGLEATGLSFGTFSEQSPASPTVPGAEDRLRDPRRSD
jgi:hypothetical protein